MPRLTVRLLCKVLLFVLFMTFFVPMLLHWSDSPGKDVKMHPKSQEVNKDAKNENLVEIPDNSQQQMEPPKLGEENEKQKTTDKLYGPKAVYKEGVIGNFEPTIVPKSGPGEMGEAVYVTMEERAAADRTIQEFGFNMVASDKVSMDRNVPDSRLEECKYWHYPTELPTASVILVFHNEGFSTLVRTVHSVINTSPPHLLKEVVMVDDFSDKEHLKTRLEEYIKRPEFGGKVKLYRNKERLGLILTRTMGARYATADVIVFLDAHCECNRNWLVPLLARVAYDRTIMAVPIVDGIDWETMRYSTVYQPGEHFRGIFEWGFLYKENRVPQKVLRMRKYDSEPYRSPTHAGGLFAMDRKYFFELGGYDPGMQIWGGENFELSFKIWQCGGSIEWVPCSRVGHIYRNHMPYGFGKISTKIPVILLNYMRVVEVWLDDEFKEYFYTREPTVRGYPIGDISKQLEFKQEKKCKSFKWFMDNVAYDVYERFPPPPPNIAWGEIKAKNAEMCWDTHGQSVNGGGIGVSLCHHYGGNQQFRYNVEGVLGSGERRIIAMSAFSELLAPVYHPDDHGIWVIELYRLNREGQLATGERCLSKSGNSIQIIVCPVNPHGPWKWMKDTGQIKHARYGTCAERNNNNKLVLVTCDDTRAEQLWEINTIKTW